MKKGDPASQHREHMHDLHALFTKKTQYHHQKAYLELKDVYWLMHEFFSAFLDKQKHWTEEEILQELHSFKHDFLVLPQELIDAWQKFVHALSEAQYSGRDLSQDELHTLVTQFGGLVDQTVGKDLAPQDSFTRHIQAAKVYVNNSDADKAETAYKQLMREYEAFDSERKRQHYEQLERLYESIAALRSGQPVSRQ